MREVNLTTSTVVDGTGLRYLTQHKALRASVLRFPEKVALVDVKHGYKKETYEELWLRSNRLANALTDLGVKKGDSVAFWTEDRLEHVEIWYACSKLGVVWTGVNARYTGKEAEYVINHSDAVVLFVSPAFVDVLKPIQANLKNVKHYIVFGDSDIEGMKSYEALLAKASDRDPEVEVRDNDWDSLCYTSGTTGTPSGSLRTQSSGFGWEFGMIQALHLTHESKVWSPYPNYHWGGNVTTRPVLASGGTRWIPGSPPDVREFFEILQKEKVNTVMAIPSIGAMICGYPDIDKYDTSCVRYWFSSGSAWLMPMREAVHKCFPNAELIDLYSCTEAFFAWATTEEVLTYERTSGFPATGNEVKIMDRDGKELPPNKWGLLCIRGISVHEGYYKNPEKTRNSFIKGEWFTAEDIGFKDEEGRVYVADRAKDIINTGGELVYPAEVENVILSHPKVAQCAVIGTPDPIYTERVTAVIVLKPGEKGSDALANEIKEFCRGKMASFKLPRKIDFVKELPYVGSGKLDKKALRAKYWKDEKFNV